MNLTKRRQLGIVASCIIALALNGCSQTSDMKGGTGSAAVPPSAAVQPVEPPASKPDLPEGQPTPNKGAEALSFLSAAHGWVGGLGYISHSTDGGQHWTQQYEGAANIEGFSFLNTNNGWAFGHSNDGTGASGKTGDSYTLLRTADGGAHWTTASTSATLGRELHFVSEKEGYSGSHATSDGGTTWKQLPVSDGTVGEPYYSSTAIGWAVTTKETEYHIERTTDGGQTWKTLYTHSIVSPVNGAVIRVTQKDDIWVQLIGDSGMTQTSYSLMHSKDDGQTWVPVVATSTAGGGPAPGYAPSEATGTKGPGNKPGQLLPLSPQLAYMLGQCSSCGDYGTITAGWTQDGGKTWTNGKQPLPGQNAQADFINEKQGFLLTYSFSEPSLLFVTEDGGLNWTKTYTFGSKSVSP